MWIDTIRARVNITSEQYYSLTEASKTKSTKAMQFFDFEEETGKERFQTRLGSYYAGLSIFYNYDHVDIEYSAHKWTKGVNGIPGIALNDRQNFAPLRLALKEIGLKYNENEILLRRIDIGSLFRLPPLVESSLWSSVSRMHFPRRKATTYPTAITWGTKNTNTYEKIYSKLSEQLSHKGTLPRHEQILEYLEHLQGVIRYECEFKPKILTSLGIETIKDYLKKHELIKGEFMKREENKIQQLPLGKGNSNSIEKALSRYAGLYKFWCEVMSLGHDVVKARYEAQNNLGRFWARRKKLRDMGVPFISIDPIETPNFEAVELQRIA